MLYKGFIGVIKAARPHHGGQAIAGGLSASNLALIDTPSYTNVRRPSKGQVFIFVTASHQTGLDTRSKARRLITVGKKVRGSSGTSRDSKPACLCCSSTH